VIVKNIWIEKLNSFLVGSTGYEYGFDYFLEGEWKKYVNRGGSNEYIELEINDEFFCSKNTQYLVYNDASKTMIQRDINQNYFIELRIWSDFEREILLFYGTFILCIDSLITIVWLSIIFFRGRNHKILRS